MKSTMFEIPEDHAEWPEWLERQVVSKELGRLVAELEAFEDSSSSATLQEICGDQLSDVLSSGLRGLSTKKLGSLLRHPQSLLELQEQAFIACSEYWDGLLADDEKRDPYVESTVVPATASKRARSTGNPLKNRIGTLVALAAGLLLAIGVWQVMSLGDGWGLARVAALSPDLDDAEYLAELADLADQWGNKVPATEAALVDRLKQFRAGCSALQNSPMSQLANSDRLWLKERCQKWTDRIDVLIGEVDSGSKTFGDGLQDANQIAGDMQSALRAKSRELA